eukprot:TRINITY_DN138_c0_g1_i1.p1 TRINITY_DN138_c0_g1~~TRINITY_DN138_c0_g1_i1.p1  ORF type:complete len:1116 (-),score=365.72 TRINITY_DN138_c0_g1_i1:252-3599(-)
MDELAEQELHDAISHLGNWHQVSGEAPTYLVNRDECLLCLKDLEILLKQDTAERGNAVHVKLGAWKVLPVHLLPLFEAYREDHQISVSVLKVAALLTSRTQAPYAEQLQNLEYLQDYKESFAKKDVFIVLMKMLVENMEEDELEEEAKQDVSTSQGVRTPEDRKMIFEALLMLLRNLVSVPDPLPGDAGFTPMRRSIQIAYIRYFYDEGFLDFMLFFAETMNTDQNVSQAWALLDILYHMCTQVNPDRLTSNRRAKERGRLGMLLGKQEVATKLVGPQTSRHSRFGTMMHARSVTGGSAIVTSVNQISTASKGSAILRREYKNQEGRTEQKRNVFQDPFFVDLEEGAAREHNQINPFARNAYEAEKDLGQTVMDGLRKFFDEFVQTSFSPLVQMLRSNCTGSKEKELKSREGRVLHEYDRQKLLNFVSWTLEFHRANYRAEVDKAKKEGAQSVPVIDISSIQAAIDVDMLQFVSARLREHGKESNLNASQLVIVLRTLTQQLKTISTIVESKDTQVRDVGEILLQNLVKEDVMANLVWILRSFKSSSHDPRVMSYGVEVFHYMLQLMTKVLKRQGLQNEFVVEKHTAKRQLRSSTSVDKEIAQLADARVVENLFYLLEKYRRHTPQLSNILVRLIHQIIKASPTNIVVFFELSYFVRIQRICTDHAVKYAKKGSQYDEIQQLLQHILRQFFKCAERNGLVFAELLFRKVQDNPKGALLESHTSEFAAILDNYEDEDYRKILDRMEAGESLSAVRARQRALQEGNLPWTEEEDEVLRDRYSVYQDHPLVAELLAAELPEDTRRNARAVRQRLRVLGLDSTGRRPAAEAGAGEPDEPVEIGINPMEADEAGEPPAKKQKTADEEVFDETALEGDLERLLDAALEMDEDPFFDAGTAPGAASSSSRPPEPAAPAAPAESSQAAQSQGDGEDFEMYDDSYNRDLEAQMDAYLAAPPQDSGSLSQSQSQSQRDPSGSAAAAPASPAAGAAASPKQSQEGDDDTENANFWEEAVRSAAPADSQTAAAASMPPPPTPQKSKAPASQEVPAAEADFDLESALDSMLDEPEEAAAAAAAEVKSAAAMPPPASPSQSKVAASQSSMDLEGDLERILDEDFAACGA